MSNFKKKPPRGYLPRKKLADINPREYTIMGSHPDFVHFNPSNEMTTGYPISHKLEKWILIVLLAFAMAAFLGFKLLENSDLSFSVSDPSATSAHSVASDSEFKSEFKKNRREARALMEDHQDSFKPARKVGQRSGKVYAKSSKKGVRKVAKKSGKKRLAKKSFRKKTLARR